jgi:hypothetical protein
MHASVRAFHADGAAVWPKLLSTCSALTGPYSIVL